jgi:peptide/nickel transport system substrate-binding protein
VTLPAFGAVPKAKDTGEKYDDSLVSNGPYTIAEYTKGQQLVLDRNPSWKDGVDGGYRGAYPDKIVLKFGVQTSVISQRLMADAGEDQTAIMREGLDTASLSTVFNDPRYEKRRINELDPYVRYIAINTKKVPNLKHRQAILAAADREQIRTIAGGSFGGDLADGLIKPNLAADYAPTGLWGGLLGDKVPPTGNVELAKKLIADWGEPMPVLTFDYGKSPDTDKIAASLQQSLGRAGITVKLNGIETGKFYSTVLDPTKQNELARAGWGPDWLNASTIIPSLFTPDGGFNLSQVNDKEFNAKVQQAKEELDRGKQATMWQELNKYAVQQAWAIRRAGRASSG